MINVAQKTVVTPQVPRWVQMIQTMIHSKVQNTVVARLRENSNAVSRLREREHEDSTQSIQQTLHRSSKRKRKRTRISVSSGACASDKEFQSEKHEDPWTPCGVGPKDHVVTRGRDESPRCEGGHSPEHHTVVLETTDEQQIQNSFQTRPHRQQNTLL